MKKTPIFSYSLLGGKNTHKKSSDLEQFSSAFFFFNYKAKKSYLVFKCTFVSFLFLRDLLGLALSVSALQFPGELVFLLMKTLAKDRGPKDHGVLCPRWPLYSDSGARGARPVERRSAPCAGFRPQACPFLYRQDLTLRPPPTSMGKFLDPKWK